MELARHRNMKKPKRARYAQPEEDNAPSRQQMRQRRHENGARYLLANMRLDDKTREALIAGQIPETQVVEMLSHFEMPLYSDVPGWEERLAKSVENGNRSQAPNRWGRNAAAVAARDLMSERDEVRARRAGQQTQNAAAIAAREMMEERAAAQVSTQKAPSTIDAQSQPRARSTGQQTQNGAAIAAREMMEERAAAQARQATQPATPQEQTQAHVEAISPQLGLRAEQVDVRVDAQAAAKTRAAATRGIMEEGVVYLDPAQYDPSTPDGAGLLAHELTHVAQQQKGGPESNIEAAEAEARGVATTIQAGGRLSAPTVGLAPMARAAEKGGTDHIQKATNSLGLTIAKLQEVQTHHLNKGESDIGAVSELDNLILQLRLDYGTISEQGLSADQVADYVAYLNSVIEQFNPPANPLGIASILYHFWLFRGRSNTAGGVRWRDSAFWLKFSLADEGKRYFHHLNPSWKSPGDKYNKAEQLEQAQRAQAELKLLIPEITHAFEQGAVGQDKKNKPQQATILREHKNAFSTRTQELTNKRLTLKDLATKLYKSDAKNAGGADHASNTAAIVDESAKLAPNVRGTPGTAGLSKAATILSVVASAVEFTEAVAEKNRERAAWCLAKAGIQLGLGVMGPIGGVLLAGWAAADFMGAVVVAGQNIKPSEGARKTGAAEDTWNKLVNIHGSEAKAWNVMERWNEVIRHRGQVTERDKKYGFKCYTMHKINSDGSKEPFEKDGNGRQLWKTFDPRTQKIDFVYTDSEFEPPNVSF